ncbi:hypothetical protein AB0K21_40390 [Streptosporangium sp. NPDC049248]|uniref:hypothetical protein n=1 Tax=Streptosporangium sp. NPDC049248 TaxID=3155651 RepID=UPI00342574C0
MIEPGTIEPVVVEPVVNREKLLELLALQAEYPTLDYKDSPDPAKEGCAAGSCLSASMGTALPPPR